MDFNQRHRMDSRFREPWWNDPLSATLPYRLCLCLLFHQAFGDSGGRRESHILWQRRPFCLFMSSLKKEMEWNRRDEVPPSLPRFDSDLPICVLNYCDWWRAHWARLIKEKSIGTGISFSSFETRRHWLFFIRVGLLCAIYRTRRHTTPYHLTMYDDSVFSSLSLQSFVSLPFFLFFSLLDFSNKVSFDFSSLRRTRYSVLLFADHLPWRVHLRNLNVLFFEASIYESSFGDQQMALLMCCVIDR